MLATEEKIEGIHKGIKDTPEDWKVCRLGDVAHLERGKFSARPRNDPKFFGGHIPFIQTGDVTNSNGQIESYSQTLNSDGLRVSKLFPSKTLFFTIAANIGDVGIAAFATACPDSLVAISPKSKIDKMWMFQALKYRKKDFENLATQNAQLNINLEKLHPYLIAIPPIHEQQTIAAALNDIDSLINSLDQLIAKKRHIKLATMQLLLTGKQRLPGFSCERKKKQLADLGDFRGGSGFPLKYQGDREGDYPFFKVSDMNNSGNEMFMTGSNNYISEQTRKNIGAIIFPKNTIIFAKVGAAIFLERKRILAQASCIDNNVMGFILKNETINLTYLYYLFLSFSFGKLVCTTALPALNGKEIGDLLHVFPSLSEQTAIADIFTDMDTEISVLEQQLSKARNLKQGMMQELLTGRIRLK